MVVAAPGAGALLDEWEPVGLAIVTRGDLLCCTCADLRYESQLENPLQRGLRRARRIRRQLGGDERLIAPFPWKPRGMRWATYGALREEALAAERAWLEAQQQDVASALRVLEAMENSSSATSTGLRHARRTAHAGGLVL